MFGFTLVDYVLLAVLAVAVHVVVNHKYVGHFVALGVLFFPYFADRFGIQHNLLIWAGDPGWRYTDMAGYGPFVLPYFAFKAYWAAWALLLAIVARVFWVRGADDVRERLRIARARFTPRVAGAMAGAAALVLVTGGFVFYNTNVLNAYVDADESIERRVRYERLYGRYDDAPMPTLTATRLNVDIRPAARTVHIVGEYDVVNRTGAPIDTIHVAVASDARTSEIVFARDGRPVDAVAVLVDDDLGHRAYRLVQPLASGDSLTLAWRVRYEPRGFPNAGVSTQVIANGTFFEQQDWMPQLGYRPERELMEASLRVEHGLPAQAGYAPLGDAAARYDTRGSERIDLDVVVATAPDQIAIAPGALVREWTEGDRRLFHYRTDAPIRNDYAIFSADYEIHRERADDVAIEIVHARGHGAHAARYAHAIAASLAYYGARIGEYPNSHIRLVEFPGYASYLHSYPMNIAQSEVFGLLDPERDERDIDFPSAVIAHEVAHQWWGNTLTPALVEGGALLSESLAWYGALGVVEHEHGDVELRRILDMLRESYLTPSSRADVPLLRASDWFNSYRKGPFAMYALREYVGAERVDGALRSFLDRWAGQGTPLPTSLDLYEALVAVTPDSLRPLLADLFERNTFWTLKTTSATADSLPSGDWRVTMTIEASKAAVDTAGIETPLPITEPIEIGVYAASAAGDPDGADGPASVDGGPDGADGEPAELYRAMHRLRAGTQTITVTVPRRPAEVGVDPRHLLIDTEPFDNLLDVSEGEASASASTFS